MKTSVVIRALNEGEHIGRLLAGLRRQSMRPDEVIVVDSGSTDNTVEVAESFGCKIVPIKKQDFSFGRALNYGCDAATGDTLILLSAHVYPVYESYVENIVRPFVDNSVDITYGKQVGDHRTKFAESRIMLKWFPDESIANQEHPFSNNANAATTKSAWHQEKYDEHLTGLEDLDYAKRVLAKGGRVAYVADAPVVHVHEESWDIVRNRYRREALAYKRIFESQQMTRKKAIRLALANIAGDISHAAKEHCLRENFSDIVLFRQAQFLGTWQGFRDPLPTAEQLMQRYYYPPEIVNRGHHPNLGEKIDYQSGEESVGSRT